MRIDAFELWCWRRLLRVPWTARRSNQSILKEISLEYSLEGLMLKLKLHYFGHLMRRTDSFEKTLMLGKVEGGRRGWQRIRWLDGITDSMDIVWVSSRSWWWTGKPGVLQSMGSPRVGHDWATELNWFVTSTALIFGKYGPISTMSTSRRPISMHYSVAGSEKIPYVYFITLAFSQNHASSNPEKSCIQFF